MKTKILILIWTLFAFQEAKGQELKGEYQKLVINFIELVKSDNREVVANLVSYPFSREYPIPTIKDKQDFIKRYDELFDEKFVKMIVSSNPSTDWADVGWRGIMLNSGALWIDYDGRLVAINYQSSAEKDRINKLIESERAALHPSIKTFLKPEYILETVRFRIRIDDMGDGKYRYASWPITKSMSDKPDLILTKGKWIPEGSGGNHRFEFKNGDFLYECSIIVLGEADSPPAMLTVYKANKEILVQDAELVKR